MLQYIEDLRVVHDETAFFTDDQEAIRRGASRDGFTYVGAPAIPGFARICMPGEAITVALRTSGGAFCVGDRVGVQYSGVGGREEPLPPSRGVELLTSVVRPALEDQPLTTRSVS